MTSEEIHVGERETLLCLADSATDLFLCERAAVDAPLLREIMGEIYVGALATLRAPKLARASLIHVCEDAVIDAPELTDISHAFNENCTYGFQIQAGAIAMVHALSRINSDVRVYDRATLEAPCLALIEGSFFVSAACETPMLAEVRGDVFVYENASLRAPQLARVGGRISLVKYAALDAPLLRGLLGTPQFQRLTCNLCGSDVVTLRGESIVASYDVICNARYCESCSRRFCRRCGA